MTNEGDARSERKAADRGRFWTFWTTLPGILTGVAAVITAVISLFAVFHSSGHSSGGAAASTVTSGFSASNGSKSATTAVNQTSGVLAQGEISQQVGDWADLESRRTGTGIPNADLALEGGELSSLGGPLAPVAGGTVDKSACVAALNAHNDEYVYLSQFHVGSQICVDTHENHVAALRIISLPGPGNSWLVYRFTVWL